MNRLEQLETQTFQQRFQIMVKYGQQAMKDAELNQWLSKLANGDFYQRLLALQACYGSYDQHLIIQFLHDPSNTLRQIAIKLAALVCDDQSIIETSTNLATPEQKKLLIELAKRKRQPVIDQLLQKMNTNRTQLMMTLPFASTSAVRLHKKFILEEASPTMWRKLATYHPDLISQWLEEKWQLTKANSTEFVKFFQAVLTVLTQQEYGYQLIVMLQKLPTNIDLDQLSLENLIRKHPEDMATVLLQKANMQQPFRHFVHVLDRLPDKTIQEVYTRAATSIYNHDQWLKKLTDPQIESLYNQHIELWRGQKNYLDTTFIMQLPAHLRTKEAKRTLTLKKLITHPENRLPYAQFLTWEKSYEELAPYLRNAHVAIRQTALCTLIKTIRFQRKEAMTVLQLLKKQKHVQDPVRLQIFHTLSQLPPSIWEETHLSNLSIIIQDALDRTDLSASTAAYIEQFVLKIVPFHTEWALNQLVTLIESQQKIYFYNFAQQITDQQAAQLLSKLMPVLKRLLSLGKDAEINDLLQHFGKRLRATDQWTTLVKPTLLQTHKRWVLEGLFNVTKIYQHQIFQKLITELLQKDPTFAYANIVSHYLHNSRQDLLTPYLGDTLYQGRLHSGTQPYLFRFTTGFERWTTKQQQQFGTQLLTIIEQGDTNNNEIQARLTQYAQLPSVDKTPLFDMIDHPKPFVRTHTLNLLGTLDQGEGIPILLNALAGPEGRTTIYALRKQLPFIHPDQMLNTLKMVPWQKVTIAKEAVRLIGKLSSNKAYQYLLELAEQQLHPDVSAALVHAMVQYYDRNEAWEVLNQLRKQDHESILSAITQIESLIPTAYLPKYLSLCKPLLEHRQAHIRLRFLYRCRELTDPKQILATTLFTYLQKVTADEDPEEATAIAKAIIDLYQASDPLLINKMFTQIKSNLYLLSNMIESVAENASWHTNKYRDTMTQLVAVLADVPYALSHRLKLAFAHLPATAIIQMIEDVITKQPLHAEAVMSAVNAIEDTADMKETTHLEQLENAFANHPESSIRRFALAALISHADLYGWTEDNRQKLAKYQQDPSSLVASAAHFTFPNDTEFDHENFDDNEV